MERKPIIIKPPILRPPIEPPYQILPSSNKDANLFGMSESEIQERLKPKANPS